MKMKILTLVLLLLACSSAAAQGFEPVNRDASPEARKLLSYLYSLRGKHTLAGQHNYNHELNKYMGVAHELTGKYPAVWGSDFILGGTKDYGPEIVEEAIKKYKEGYIVTLMWHAGRPQDDPPYGWKESIQGELTDAQWKELTTPGTPLNLRWQAQADRVAGHLKRLRDAGLVQETRHGRNAYLYANTEALQVAMNGLSTKIPTTDEIVIERLRRYAAFGAPGNDVSASS